MKVDAPAISTAPISILACGGGLPLEIAEVLKRQGRELNIVAIEGMADADYAGFSLQAVSIGRIGGLLKALRTNGNREMLIAGHATRPDLKKLRIDSGFVRHAGTVLGLMRGGDDHVLRQIARFFEQNGLIVKGIAEVAPEILTPSGHLAGEAHADATTNAVVGLKLIHKLGAYDVGQAVVIEDGNLIAIEGAEGTDRLIARLPKVNATQSNTSNDSARILIKAAKPDQDLRVDLPTIGTETIERCAAANIGTIALEAGRSLIVDRAATIQRAHELGITLIGLDANTNATSNQSRSDTQASTALSSQQPMTLRNFTRTTMMPAMRRDAAKGLQVLEKLKGVSGPGAVIISRENVLAIRVNEPLTTFIERSEQLLQWGDRRGRGKRNRTLALSSSTELDARQLGVLANTKVGCIVLQSIEGGDAALDHLLPVADQHKLSIAGRT